MVTVGNYFKHLMMYKDGRFARHPHFCYNTEMRWCALQTGRIYVRQYSPDAQLSVKELWKVNHFQTVFCTMPPVYVEQDSTGYDSEVDTLPWWTHSVCLQPSSLIVQQTSSGLNLQQSYP